MDTQASQLKEEWKPVVGFEGLYEVSSLGRVRSLDRVVSVKNKWGSVGPREMPGHLFCPHKTGKSKYYSVVLPPQKRHSIHRLVAYAFLKKTPNKNCINHKNGNKLDNRAVNLEWCTFSENTIDAINSGRLWKIPIFCGEKHGQAKLTDDIVRQIRKEYKKTKNIDLAERFNINPGVVSRVARGLAWSHIK